MAVSEDMKVLINEIRTANSQLRRGNDASLRETNFLLDNIESLTRDRFKYQAVVDAETLRRSRRFYARFDEFVDVFTNNLAELRLKETQDSVRSNYKDDSSSGDMPYDDEKLKFDLSKQGAAFIGIASLFVGTIRGIIMGHLQTIRAFTPQVLDDAIKGVVNNIRNSVKTIGNTLTKITSNISDMFRSMGRNIGNEVTKTSKTFNKVFSTLRAIAEIELIKPFVNLTKSLIEISKIFGRVGSVLKVAANVGRTILRGFTLIAGYFSAIGILSKTIGKVVSKVFVPLNIIITAFDTVRGILDGYAKEGFWGGLKGGIKGMFNSLISIPLDIIKGMTAWIVNLFGFENVAETLRSFKFEDLFNNFIDRIFRGAVEFPKWLWQKWENMIGKMQESFNSMTAYISETISVSVTNIRNKVSGMFHNIVDWFGEVFTIDNIVGLLKKHPVVKLINVMFEFYTSIPGKIIDIAKTALENAMDMFKINFIKFGNWIGSLPSAIYLNALEYLKDSRVGNWLITDGMMDSARKAYENELERGGRRIAKAENDMLARQRERDIKFMEDSEIEKGRQTTNINTFAPVNTNYGGNMVDNSRSISNRTGFSDLDTDPASLGN